MEAVEALEWTRFDDAEPFERPVREHLGRAGIGADRFGERQAGGGGVRVVEGAARRLDDEHPVGGSGIEHVLEDPIADRRFAVGHDEAADRQLLLDPAAEHRQHRHHDQRPQQHAPMVLRRESCQPVEQTVVLLSGSSRGSSRHEWPV